MALPIAHWAVALGVVRTRDRLVLTFVAALAILPDFDFALVWEWGLPMSTYHRTFSHSLAFFVCLVVLWKVLCPSRLRSVTPTLFLVVLLSHSALDVICTADAVYHGVMLFWPFVHYRVGWPILVPLYRLFASSPFSLTPSPFGWVCAGYGHE